MSASLETPSELVVTCKTSALTVIEITYLLTDNVDKQIGRIETGCTRSHSIEVGNRK